MIIGNAFGAGEAFDVHEGMGDWKSWLGGQAKSIGVSAAKGAAGAVAGRFSKKKAAPIVQQPQQVVMQPGGGSSVPAPEPSKIKPWMIGAGLAAVVGIGFAMSRRGAK